MLLDEAGILKCIADRKPDAIYSAEDGVTDAGFGSRIAMLLESQGIALHFEAIGVPAEPLDHGSVAELYQKAGIDPEGIAARILRGTELLRKEQRV